MDSPCLPQQLLTNLSRSCRLPEASFLQHSLLPFQTSETFLSRNACVNFQTLPIGELFCLQDLPVFLPGLLSFYLFSYRRKISFLRHSLVPAQPPMFPYFPHSLLSLQFLLHPLLLQLPLPDGLSLLSYLSYLPLRYHLSAYWSLNMSSSCAISDCSVPTTLS